jgi:hypothetical protein
MTKKMTELTGAEVNKGIEDSGSGGTMITGAGIDFYKLLTIRQALQLQMIGMRMSSRLPQGTTLARRHLGLKGNKESLLRQVQELIDRIQAERAADAAERTADAD